jgi:ethanolamine permease
MDDPLSTHVELKPRNSVEAAHEGSTDGSPRKQQHIATFWHIFALGIVLTVGGIHVTWNEAIRYGFGQIVVVFTIVSIGFLCLILCSSEMTGLLPFSGGSYGFARVTLGPYIGFIIGCLDAFRCLVYVIRRTIYLGTIIAVAFPTTTDYTPIYWLVFFIPAIFIDSLGQRKFWGFVSVLAIFTLLFSVLYFLVAAPGMDFERYVLDNTTPNFSNSYRDFVLAMPAVARMYQGIATIPLSCEETKNAQVNVPRAMIATLSLTFFLGLTLIFACCSHGPSLQALGNTDFPLSFGFANGLHIALCFGPIFSFVAVYATCFGYSYSYGRILCAMARSGLLPTWISTVRGERDTPIVGIVLGNLIMYVIMLSLNFTNSADLALSAAALIATVVVYWSVFASFCILRMRFSNLKRIYINPFGIPSAVIGASIFAVLVSAVLRYVDYNNIAMIIFAVFVVTCTFYYVVYAAKTKCYSEEEQSIMLVLYVMKANKMRRTKKKKPNFIPYRAAVSSTAAIAAAKYTDRHSDHNNSGNETNAETLQTSFRQQVVRSLRKVVPVSSNTSDSKVETVIEDGKMISVHDETRQQQFSSSNLHVLQDKQGEEGQGKEANLTTLMTEEMTIAAEQQQQQPLVG